MCASQKNVQNGSKKKQDGRKVGGAKRKMCFSFRLPDNTSKIVAVFVGYKPNGKKCYPIARASAYWTINAYL